MLRLLIFLILLLSLKIKAEPDITIDNQNTPPTIDSYHFPVPFSFSKQFEISAKDEPITRIYTIDVTHYPIVDGINTFGVVLVVEIVKNQPNTLRNLCSKKNLDIIITSEVDKIEVCDKLEQDDQYEGNYVNVFFVTEFKVWIELNNFEGALRLTATSNRKNNGINLPCYQNEFPCKIKPYSICVNKQLQCNKQLNCGKMNDFDESPWICGDMQKQQQFVMMVGYSVGLGLILLYIAVQVVRIWCYKRPKIKIKKQNKIVTESNRLLLELESQSEPPTLASHVFSVPLGNSKRNLDAINEVNAKKSAFYY